MINSLVFMGRLENFCKHKKGIKLLISHRNDDGDFVIPVFLPFKPKNDILELLEEDMIIAIKGHVALDNKNQIVIIGDKLTFLSSKKGDVYKNESD